jgi:hypothetical protein
VSDLTAIDVLIDPDEATMEGARAVNARMLQSLPQGWALDDTHQPHITTLQRYVRTADLDKVYEAVGKTLAQTDMASLSYRAVKIEHADWGFPGYGPAVLLVEVSPEVLEGGRAELRLAEDRAMHRGDVATLTPPCADLAPCSSPSPSIAATPRAVGRRVKAREATA